MHMHIRERFDRKLSQLRADILAMGSQVEEELSVALKALQGRSQELAGQVYLLDRVVNQMRFAIEEQCFALIVTQQPAARDLRLIVSAMNMIVDLERMGDQAKGIAKVIPHLIQHQDLPYPPELRQMGVVAGEMVHQAMRAYADDDVALARTVAARDNEQDRLYELVFTQIMVHMAQAGNPDRIEAIYEMLRVARELERFGDLATNVAERAIYMVTGMMEETNLNDPNR